MSLPANICYAVRLLSRKPLFTAAMVLTFGVCIGAVTAVFSVIDATLLRPLPFPEPERLAQLVVRYSSVDGLELQNFQNGATWERFKESSRTTDFAVYRGGTENLNFSSGGSVGYIRRQRVSSGFFRVFGIDPFMGREFTPLEDVPNGPPVAILSHSLWQRALGADPNILGRRVAIAGVDYQVVGVASEQFESPTDIWTPLRPSPQGEGQGINYVIAGRVRAGSVWEEAQAEMASIGEALLEGRVRRGVTAQYTLTSLQEAATQTLSRSLWVVLGATVLVLIIGCVNIAGMLMAQSTSRTAEMATRMAMGANRAMIIRQMLTESLTIALAGTLVGIVIGHFGLDLMKQSLPPTFSALQTARLDLRVLVAVGVVALLGSVVFGLIPALHAGAVDIRTAQSSRSVIGSKGSLVRRVLSTVQIAIAVVVLIGAGLLVRSFSYLSNLDPGLDAANVITANFALLDARYANAEAAIRYFDDVVNRLQDVPGVEAAAVSLTLPYERGMNIIVSRPTDSENTLRLTNWAYVSPQFFEAFRIPVLRGRSIEDADRAGSAPVVVVNDAFAKMYFRDEEPLGSTLVVFEENRQIVGVVGDVLQQAGWGNYGPMGRVPTVYVPVAQPGFPGLSAPSPSWIVRTTAALPGIQREIEEVVKSVDPLLPVATYRSMNEINIRSLGLQRFSATLLAIAAGLSLFLASLGTFAMISNSVAERSREFGIRMALGATVTRTIGTCAKSGLVCAAIGLASGVAAARLGTGLLQSMLYGVTPLDRETFIYVGAAVVVVAAIASLVPALRIVRLDPAQILRHD